MTLAEAWLHDDMFSQEDLLDETPVDLEIKDFKVSETAELKDSLSDFEDCPLGCVKGKINGKICPYCKAKRKKLVEDGLLRNRREEIQEHGTEEEKQAIKRNVNALTIFDKLNVVYNPDDNIFWQEHLSKLYTKESIDKESKLFDKLSRDNLVEFIGVDESVIQKIPKLKGFSLVLETPFNEFQLAEMLVRKYVAGLNVKPVIYNSIEDTMNYDFVIIRITKKVKLSEYFKVLKQRHLAGKQTVLVLDDASEIQGVHRLEWS